MCQNQINIHGFRSPRLENTDVTKASALRRSTGLSWEVFLEPCPTCHWLQLSHNRSHKICQKDQGASCPGLLDWTIPSPDIVCVSGYSGMVWVKPSHCAVAQVTACEQSLCHGLSFILIHLVYQLQAMYQELNQTMGCSSSGFTKLHVSTWQGYIPWLTNTSSNFFFFLHHYKHIQIFFQELLNYHCM